MQTSNNSSRNAISESRGFVRSLLKQYAVLFLVFGSLALVGTAKADSSALSIEGSWIREAPPGVPTLAAYMNITNTSESPISILGVSSNIAKMTELHEVKIENDVMQMRRMTEIILDPGETLELKAGGSHVMLMGVEQTFTAGDEVEIEFELSDQTSVKVKALVKKDL